jgi:hypothetical protein
MAIVLLMIIIIIIQFNSYSFTCKLNTTEANYKVSTSKKKNNKTFTNKIQNKAVNIVIIIQLKIKVIIKRCESKIYIFTVVKPLCREK